MPSIYVLLLAGIVIYFLILAWIFRDRPLTDYDRYCAKVDEEIERREMEAKDERKARSDLYGKFR